MLELFRRNHFLISLLLLPYSVLLGLDFFLDPKHMEYPVNSTLYAHFFAGLEGHPFANGVIAVVLIFFEAVMINRIFLQHRLSRKSSLFPGVIYIILMNMLPEVRGVHDVLIANFFVILMISNAFPLIRLFKTEKFIFNIGFWTALSFVLFPGYIILVPFLLISLFILRKINFLETGQLIIGFIDLLILMAVLIYVCGWDCGYSSLYVNVTWSNILSVLAINQNPYGFYLGILYFLLLLGSIRYYAIISKQDFKVQKKVKLTFWIAFLLLISPIFVTTISPHHMLVLTVPLSLIVGIMLTHWKQNLLAEVIHLFVVLGILYLHFQIII